MAEKPRIEWEEIRGRVTKGKNILGLDTITLYRTKVPGGWVLFVGPNGAAFYPDPEHQWDGKSLP